MPGQPFITGDRIDLRTAEESDIEFLLAGVNHPDVRRYISVFDTPYTETRYREELWPVEHDEEGVSLLAVPTAGEREGDPVGSVQLYPLDPVDGWANLGVWFLPTAWGNGYAIEACARLIEYGFRQRRLHRLSATTVTQNAASVTLCERLGFVHEGTTRETQFVAGAFVDVERFGLLVDEWRGLEAVLDS